MIKKIMSLLFILMLSMSAFAADLNMEVNRTAEYMLKAVTKPEVGSIGGEWAIIGLARSTGTDVPDSYFDGYYKTVEQYVKDCDGVLHDKKYTEYSRVILGLTAAGYDPQNVAGYDLTQPLADFPKTIWQGINGPIFALIALDSGSYSSDLRDEYVAEILRRQLTDGGFNLTGGADEKSDPDLTGMALQALAKYQDKPEVKAATDRALLWLSEAQNEIGGYVSWGSANSESAVQVLVALCELGIPLDDSRFVKNGNSLLDNIMSFSNENGSFKHTADGSGNNQMSTEQAFYGIVSAQRASEGENSLYRMDDAVKRVKFSVTEEEKEYGLPNKHADVLKMPVISEEKTFSDVKNHESQAAIEELASRGIIGGKTEITFDPEATMTRAEFAAIITRGLGFSEKAVTVFSDVEADAWYVGYVGTAYTYGIVTGTSATTFNPNGTITKQEAAVMTARAAKLCGMKIELEESETRDMLAQFGDYVTVSDWAKEPLAFCYASDILSQDEFDIEPNASIKRCEIAEMLFQMLTSAKLM